MKKIIFITLIIIMVASCQNSENTNDSNKDIDTLTNTTVEFKKTKDKFVAPAGDSLLYDGTKYAITSTQEGDYDKFSFHIHDKAQHKKYNYDLKTVKNSTQLFYLGVSKDYLILDDGTGNIRNLIIIEMSTGEIIEIIKYVDVPEIGVDKVYYYVIIDKLPSSVKAPKCPKVEGVPDNAYKYIEKCSFSFNSLKASKLGKYKCKYFQ